MNTETGGITFSRIQDQALRDLRQRSIFELGKWDQQYGDKAVFSNWILSLERSVYRTLADSAEKLSRELIEAEERALKQPEVLGRLGLPRKIVRTLKRAGHFEHREKAVRLCRFDFHPTREGWKISEVNSDVPGGLIESDGWSRLVAEQIPDLECLPGTVDSYLDTLVDETDRRLPMGLMHASAYSDDRQTMIYLQGELKKRGVQGILVNPDNIAWHRPQPEVDAEWYRGPLSRVIRFYPGEWLANLDARTGWEKSRIWGSGAVSNPLSSLISQSKRFPLIWNELGLDMSEWRARLPDTRAIGLRMLGRRNDWLIKSSLGRVGDGIWFPGVTAKKQFREMLPDFLFYPNSWVAQRPFQALRWELDGESCTPCLGLFTVNGKAKGIYGRLASKGMIDSEAQDLAVLLEKEGKADGAFHPQTITKDFCHEPAGII